MFCNFILIAHTATENSLLEEDFVTYHNMSSTNLVQRGCSVLMFRTEMESNVFCFPIFSVVEPVFHVLSGALLLLKICSMLPMGCINLGPKLPENIPRIGVAY